jgi:PAS domain S-box-containing protein
LAESQPDSMVRYDLQCRALYANPALTSTVARKFWPMLGKTPSENHPGHEGIAEYQRIIKRVIATGEPATLEMPIEHPSGELRTHHIRCVAAWDSYGEIVGALVIGRDISERIAMERNIRETNANLAAILDAIPDMLVETDLNGICLQLWLDNPALQVEHRQAMLGRSFAEILPPEDAEKVLSSLREALENGHSIGQEVRRLHAAGARWFELSISRKSVNDGGEPRFIILFRVITERKRLEAALLKREEQFRALAENSPDLIFRFDREGLCIYVNKAALMLTGRTRDELIGGTPADCMFLERNEAEKAVRLIRQTLASGKPAENEVRFASSGGCQHIFHSRIVPEFGLDAVVTGVLCVSRDITAMKAAERELGESRDRLRELAAHIEEEREAERRHLAHELHEDLAQMLAALRMAVFATQIRFGTEGTEHAAMLRNVIAMLDLAIKTVRDLSSQLGPVIVDRDVLPALESLLGAFRARGGQHCELRVSEDAMVLEEKQATAVFRIVEEALANVSRHAEARRVEVTLARSGGELNLSIRDDGKGFDPERRGAKSFGLIGMRERAETLGGYLELSSAPERGTTVQVRLPVGEGAS